MSLEEEQEIQYEHPYKSALRAHKLPFPKIISFTSYLRMHFGARLVRELNTRMFEGELCGIDGSRCRKLEHRDVRIDSVTYWWENRWEFLADLKLVVTFDQIPWDDEDSRKITHTFS